MTIIPFRKPPVSSGFTQEDLRTFRRWDGGHYRVEIDEGEPCETLGQFAMIYEGASCWASWAVGREGGGLVVWDCVSLRTLGRFASLRAALAAIPGAPAQGGWPCMAEIIAFDAAGGRRGPPLATSASR